MKAKQSTTEKNFLAKSPTGIEGLDEITRGGLPKGRPTLIAGNAGCGKTLLGMEFLVRGAIEFNEPGVFMAFEETEQELYVNVASLGFDLEKLIADKKLFIDHVHIERSEIEETGEYDLEGLFIRLRYAIDSIGAKRVVIDTLESLFAGLPNQGILRAEIRRLFRWLKEKGVTAIITGERGNNSITNLGLEEYASDCVILLDHRVTDQTSTRRLRIVKYRGSIHGTNEYPFLIDEKGITVLPITSLGLTHKVSSERISTGIKDLDTMLGKKGFFRGSSILITGTAGTGKSSLANHFASETCGRGERVLYFSLEESPAQIIRNMNSIGINLEPFLKKRVLEIFAMRPTLSGLEMHLTTMLKAIKAFKPSVVIVDPLNSFLSIGNPQEARSLAMRLIDYLKLHQITGLFTSLTSDGESLEYTNIYISSLIDTWLLLRDIEIGGERNRGIYVLKSRGMSHSNQIREFLITDHGVVLRDVYVGMEGVLTGSARVAQEAKDNSEKLVKQQIIVEKKNSIDRKKKNLEAKILSLRTKFEADKAKSLNLIEIEKARLEKYDTGQKEIGKSRHAESGKKTIKS